MRKGYKQIYRRLIYSGLILSFIGGIIFSHGCKKEEHQGDMPAVSGMVQRGGKTVLNSAILVPGVIGYAGEIPLEITINQQGVIASINILKNRETPSFINWIRRDKFLDHWVGITPEVGLTKKVDTITGATMSTAAMRQTLRGSLGKYLNLKPPVEAVKPINFIRLISGIIVVILGLLMAFLRPKKKWLRWVQLLLNIGVLGFFGGYFLSLTTFMTWSHHGVALPGAVVALLMIAMVIILPFLKRKQSYCSWVCPFGALQDVAGQINPKKIKLPKAVLKKMVWVRRILLILLVISVWVTPGLMLLHYEPFTAFWFQTASPMVLGIAGGAVFLSLFINRFWCRCLCPTGEVLSWFDRLR